MKGDAQVVLLILCFFFGCLLAFFLDNRPMENTIIAIIGFFSALAASFSGARYAFKLQESKNIQTEKARQSTIGNLVVFRLAKIHHELYAIKKQTIDPYKDDPARQFLIKPPPALPEAPDLDLDSLAFLFETSHLNLPGELHALQLQTKALTSLIEKRSEIYITQYLATAERLNLKQDQKTTVEEMEAAIGYRYSAMLREYTNMMIKDIDECISHLREHIDRLSSAFEELYPRHKVIRIDFQLPLEQS